MHLKVRQGEEDGENLTLRSLRLTYDVVMAATKTVTVFWNVTPYSLLVVYPRFGGNFALHNQGTGNVREISNLITVVAGSYIYIYIYIHIYI